MPLTHTCWEAPVPALFQADDGFLLQPHRVLSSTGFERARLSPAYFKKSVVDKKYGENNEMYLSREKRAALISRPPKSAALLLAAKSREKRIKTAEMVEMEPPLEEKPAGSLPSLRSQASIQPKVEIYISQQVDVGTSTSTAAAYAGPDATEMCPSLDGNVESDQFITKLSSTSFLPADAASSLLYKTRSTAPRTPDQSSRERGARGSITKQAGTGVRFRDKKLDQIHHAASSAGLDKTWMRLGRLFRREGPTDSALDTSYGTLYEADRCEWTKRRKNSTTQAEMDDKQASEEFIKSWKTLNQTEFINHVMSQVNLPEMLKRRLNNEGSDVTTSLSRRGAWDSTSPFGPALIPTPEAPTKGAVKSVAYHRAKGRPSYSTNRQYTFVRHLAQSVVKADPEEFLTLYESLPKNLSFRHLEAIKELTRRMIHSRENDGGD